MQTINRSRFLKTLGRVFTGILLTPFCYKNKFKGSLPFSGSICGEKHAIGHQFRDKNLELPSIKPEHNVYDVVIVGGGISGLVTAHKLNKTGLSNILVLEKEDVPGGLCLGKERNGIPYACGAHYTEYPEPDNHYVNEIFKDCGIITGYEDDWPIVDDKFLIKKKRDNLFINGKWEPYDYPFSIATKKDLQEYERFDDESLQLSKWRDSKGLPAFGLPLENISQHSKVRNLDKISFYEYLTKNGYTSKLLYWHCNIWSIDEYGTALEDISAWAGLQFFRHKIKPPGKKTFTITFPQGLGYLSQKLASFLHKRIVQTKKWVLNIEEFNSRVFITTWDETKQGFIKFQAKKAVFALPKSQVYMIIPSLKRAGRNEFDNLSYAPWLVANIHLKQLSSYSGGSIRWENTIYDSWTLGYINNQHLMTNKPNEPHVLTLYACFPKDLKKNRTELLERGWEHWARVVLAELQKAHPKIENLITQLDIWIWGHPMRQPLVGTVWGNKRQQMLKPFGNIHFSHVDVCGVPVVEEAIHRGMKVAYDLIGGG
ncbi:MAG: FAD-dependent oxidoreductase [Leptospiraceae bacterium]|nr:FAD-dependent oxidoreductase [Leptospiraceae bacterium]MCP5497656.1 FAD-dependent oxidoreductase [Leptospiraceae bacterium]